MWDWEGVVLWVLSGIGIAFCTVVIGFIVFIGFDSVGIEGNAVSAVVLEKTFEPEATVTSFVTVGTVQVPQVQTYPATWKAVVRTDVGQVVACEISQSQYPVVVEGAIVEVGVGSGRLSGTSYCTSFAVVGPRKDQARLP